MYPPPPFIKKMPSPSPVRKYWKKYVDCSLDGEEEPGDDPEEEVEDGRDHEHQHRPVQRTLLEAVES